MVPGAIKRQAGLRMENPVEDAYSFRVENRWTSRDSIGLVAVLVVPRTPFRPPFRGRS